MYIFICRLVYGVNFYWKKNYEIYEQIYSLLDLITNQMSNCSLNTDGSQQLQSLIDFLCKISIDDINMIQF